MLQTTKRTPRVLPDLSQQLADMQAQINALAAENAKLKAGKVQTMTFKVSEKGCLSVYGLGRFPITAYASQWLRIIDKVAELKAFIEANKDKLAWKE